MITQNSDTLTITGDGTSFTFENSDAGIIFTDEVKVAAMLFVNETANANMSIGLTLNQGGADNEILAFKSSDVDHGVTLVTETDSFAVFGKYAATGGIEIKAITPLTTAVEISGYAATGDTTKNASGLGVIQLNTGDINGTGTQAWATDENLVVIQNSGSTRFIFDEDGDMYYDGAAPANYDAFDDAEAAHDLQRVLYNWDKPKEKQLMDFKRYSKDEIISLGVVNDGGFVSMKRMNSLILGAISQLDTEDKSQLEYILSLEARIEQLENMVESLAFHPGKYSIYDDLTPTWESTILPMPLTIKKGEIK